MSKTKAHIWLLAAGLAWAGCSEDDAADGQDIPGEIQPGNQGVTKGRGGPVSGEGEATGDAPAGTGGSAGMANAGGSAPMSTSPSAMGGQAAAGGAPGAPAAGGNTGSAVNNPGPVGAAGASVALPVTPAVPAVPAEPAMPAQPPGPDETPAAKPETTLMAKVIKTKLLIADVVYVKQIKLSVAGNTELNESKQEKRYERAKNSSDVEQPEVRATVIYAEDIEADEVRAKQVFAQQVQYF